ncbi:hypothetical protein GCM10010112_17050 [Actinoplanes lobatus]|uniref:Calx-beta domain-containing protein n=1 Tax=Actinoplanes lobatus TaxID=113568 RepID=A0A7W7HA30_9ACTN|nr:Calx-beta domain-containing protein [Actinoplanes lobatus]MBB4746332.1 hypothetical protein [Actinoplanes lobatus]GGN60603.1 hypothetical protein GCM10010112_17050 [Actinoplanes lobatus]GIE41222.1 hypothetical protein Alo02nite_41200 [Actinoplanes lobatus]
MRYRQAHAAKSGSVPFALRGPKSLRGALLAAVATAASLVAAAPASADALPTLSIAPPSGTLTEAGTASFVVTASAASAVPITVKWNVVDVTPAAGHAAATPSGTNADLTAPLSGTAIIAANATTTTIDVATAADTLFEDPEDFAVEISEPTNATLGTPTKATATITDDETAPTVAITPIAVTEGNAGTRQQTFTATLSGTAGKTVKADWSTVSGGAGTPGIGDAVLGRDFVGANGTLTFPAGTTTQTFMVDIIGDAIDEGPATRVDATDGEVFEIVVAPVAGESPASVVGGSTEITITDDDAAPTVTFDNLAVNEGSDTAAVLLPIKLSNGSDHPIAFTIAPDGAATTAVDTATGVVGDNDFAHLGTAATIGPEMTSGYAAVLVNGDGVNEPDETVGLTVTPDAGDDGATWLTSPGADPAALTLKNDDKAPDLEIRSGKGKEGDTVDVVGTVTGISQTGANLTLTFTGAAADGHRAASASDFTPPSTTTVSIPAGTLAGTELPVPPLKLKLYDDTEAEPAESIVVSGTGTGGTVTSGVIVIEANDGYQPAKPTISASSTKIDGPGPVTITGKVGAGETVELWGAPVAATKQPLKKLTSATADGTGAYSFSRTITTGYRFQTKSQEGVTSSEITVRVMQDPVFTAASGAKGKLTLRVAADPKLAKAAVTVERYSGGKWSATSWKGSTDAKGVWQSTVSAKAGSSWTLRARVGGSAAVGVDAGYSATKKVTVKK